MSKREYNGDPLDMSWQTPPWKNDGETLDAYSSDGDNEITMETWPENATDREELSTNAQKLILTAARYPSVNNSKKLMEKAGIDNSHTYPNQVLSQHWPERYWAGGEDNNNHISNIARSEVRRYREHLLDGGHINQLIKDTSRGHKTISGIVQGTRDDLPECEIPPMRYKTSPGKWVTVDEADMDEADMDEADMDDTDSVTTEELRERALNGESAAQISEDVDYCDSTIAKMLIGSYDHHNPDSDIPPLEYNQSTGEYEIAEEGKGEEHSEEQTTYTATATARTTEPRDTGMPAWVWGVVGAILAWIASKVLR